MDIQVKNEYGYIFLCDIKVLEQKKIFDEYVIVISNGIYEVHFSLKHPIDITSSTVLLEPSSRVVCFSLIHSINNIHTSIRDLDSNISNILFSLDEVQTKTDKD